MFGQVTVKANMMKAYIWRAKVDGWLGSATQLIRSAAGLVLVPSLLFEGWPVASLLDQWLSKEVDHLETIAIPII